ncbi:hypothetical protein GCK32_004075 [Trichostrongylus colubriformis]|uniref:Uncharacterized protein n=1 Tax=Trichostrongylus colubriformis TaxID=6319 RepID=A0AAN8EV12_TRICO
MARRVDWWLRQVYLGIIPSYPIGYMIVNGYRDEQFWTNVYVERSSFPPSEHLKDLVEAEMDKIEIAKNPKVRVSLTSSSEPRVYGCFFLQSGAELQFPMRVSFADVEEARRLANNIELDMGLARHRRKIEVNSKIGEELTSRMILSDAAKMFIVQRQLQLANSGTMFSAPMIAWFGIFAAGYGIAIGISSAVGIALGIPVGLMVSAVTFRQFLESYNAYKLKWADEKTISLGEGYLEGARDYFASTMKFNKLLRFVSVIMRLSRAVLSYRKWNEQATAFLQTKAGRRLRIGLLGGTIIAYPLGSLLINGPLLNFTFPRRYSVEELPPRLKEIAREEYEHFLESESRVEKDAVVTQHLGTSLDEFETIAAGSLGVRTGLHLAVPCHARFTNVDEALTYLSGTLQLALRFMFLRDLHAHDGYASLAQRSISWATWTSFTSIFTYWLHKSSRICGGTATSFAVIYTLFVSAAWFANKQWYYLYRYVTDVHADSVAARTSFSHCEGGKELYWKQLKRHRIMRDVCHDLKSKITPSGDIRGIATPIIVRYDHLKDLNEEDDELKEVRMSSIAVGLGACALSSLFFGSAYVPIKRFDASNGEFFSRSPLLSCYFTRIFVQWVMATGILCVGMAVNAFEEFPKFQPLAMLGGVFWALGRFISDRNVTAVPIMNALGLGMGMLIWGATNCICGWAVGRFGLFGVHATVPSLPLLNYLGLLMVIIGGVFFSQIRPTPSIPNTVETEERSSPVRGYSEEDSPLLDSASSIGVDRRRKRFIAVGVALLAGFFYGVTFVPVLYIQDHPKQVYLCSSDFNHIYHLCFKFPDASRNGLAYVFSHYCGIFLTATLLLVLYIAYSGVEQPHREQQDRRPEFAGRMHVGYCPELLEVVFCSAAVSRLANCFRFVANDSLSQSVTFPIISMVPGVCAAMWSVFYFKEIRGYRNQRILCIAICTTLIGAVLVGVSK